MFMCICFPFLRFCCHSNPMRERERVQGSPGTVFADGFEGLWAQFVLLLFSGNYFGFQVFILIIFYNSCQWMWDSRDTQVVHFV